MPWGRVSAKEHGVSRASEGSGMEPRLGNLWRRTPGVDSRVDRQRLALPGSEYPGLRGKWIVRCGRSACDPRDPGSETWAWWPGTFSGLVLPLAPRILLEPSALLLEPERTLPFYGPESEGSGLAWAVLHCWAGHAAYAWPLGPVPWAGWGYFWDRAGALGLVSDVPM